MNHHGYYNEGWTAYWLGQPFHHNATLDWRDGWKDAEEADIDGYEPTEADLWTD